MSASHQTLALSLVVALTLSACSGGGSKGGHTAPQATAAPQASPTTTQTSRVNAAQPAVTSAVIHQEPASTPQTSPPPTTATPSVWEKLELDNHVIIARNEFKQGEIRHADVGYGTLTGYNRRYSFNGVWGDWKTEVNQLNIEGKLVELATNKFTAYLGGLYGKGLQTMLTFLQKQDNRKEVFYFGDETPLDNMPTQGSAVYRGNATRFDNIGSSEAKLANVGTSTLYADFGNKTISGELDMNGLRRDITLHSAKIDGNSFKGRAVAERNLTNWISREGVYEGKFFGPNADEVAGKAEFTGSTVIGSVSDLNTSFSAEKVSSR